jgi:hypothetical protein
LEEEEDPVAEAVDEAPEDALLPPVEVVSTEPVVLPALFVAAEPLSDVDAALAVRKYELMHEDWQEAYCAVSPAVPLP